MFEVDITAIEGYEEAVAEYEPGFVQEYYEENDELPESGLEVVYLGPLINGRSAQWEAMGRHYANYYEDMLADSGVSLEYVTINHESIGRDELNDWGETNSWAFR